MSYLAKATGLAKTYGTKAVLDGVSITIEGGCITGFVGANGAGKTTTIRALLGLMPLDGGEVVLFGEQFGVQADGALATRIKGRIGVVLDTCPFIGELRVKAVGAAVRAAYPTWRQELFEEYLRRFELDPKKKVKELSRGMGMKLQLACALAHEPELLVLDEATAGLDPLARDEVLDILRGFVSDELHGILISSHITSDLERIADTVVCIDAGRIVFDLPKEVITDEMGIARCRASEFEQVAQSGFIAPGEMRYVRNPYGIDLVVPDRLAFARRFPEIACERASIDEFMQITLKGDIR